MKCRESEDWKIEVIDVARSVTRDGQEDVVAPFLARISPRHLVQTLVNVTASR